VKSKSQKGEEGDINKGRSVWWKEMEVPLRDALTTGPLHFLVSGDPPLSFNLLPMDFELRYDESRLVTSQAVLVLDCCRSTLRLAPSLGNLHYAVDPRFLPAVSSA
jgi:hypothetical protein